MPVMTALAAAFVLQAGAAAFEPRSLLVSVTDAKGAPVRGLGPEDVAILENGVARTLDRFEAERRPLTLVVLVDTSQPLASVYRLNVVDAVLAFLKRLPEGSRYALWTTGDRPRKLVDFTDDPAPASQALKRVSPQGGNTLLDALVEASRDLKTREGQRTAVVAVTGFGIEFSSRERHQVVAEAEKSAATFAAASFEEGPVRFEDRQKYDFVLSRLTQETGGLHETTLSAMGLASALAKIAADLDGQYRLTYAGLQGGKAPKLEVKVARPGVRVRVARKP